MKEQKSPIKIRTMKMPPRRRTSGMCAQLGKLKAGSDKCLIIPEGLRTSAFSSAKYLGIKVASRKIDSSSVGVWRTA